MHAAQLVELDVIIATDAPRQLDAFGIENAHHVAPDEVALHGDYALGQQAGAFVLHGGNSALIDLDFTVRGRAGQNPALASFQRGSERREQGTDTLTSGETTDHLRHLAGGDHHLDPGTARHIGRLQLGCHATRAEPADTATRQLAQRVVYGLHLFYQLCIRVAARIGSKQACLIGQQDQQIGISQDGGTSREVVVVPHLDLGGCHGVVLVDDGNDAMIEQGSQRIASVEVTLPVLQIGAGQQHLTDMQPIEVEQVLPYPDELGLAYRRQHLLVGQSRRQRRVTQMFTPGGNGPRGDHHDSMAVTMQGGTLSDQLHHVGTVKLGRSPCEHAGAQFDDYGSVFHGSKKAEKLGIPLYPRPCCPARQLSPRAVLG